MKRILISLALCSGLSVAACGDDDGGNNPVDGGGDATVGDSSVVDGGVEDGSVTNPDGMVEDDATVGGDIMVTTSISAVGEPAANVDVETLDVDGNTVSTGTADGSGNITLGAPRDAVFFVWVKPTESAMGILRPQPANGNDFTINGGLALEGRDDYAVRVMKAGQTYDDTKGNFVAGINVADSDAGGETVTLDNIVSGSPFVIKTEEAVLVQNSVPPLCTGDNEPCREIEQRTEVFFPNANLGMGTPAVTGGEGTCTVRTYDGAYPIKADTRTLANIDCE